MYERNSEGTTNGNGEASSEVGVDLGRRPVRWEPHCAGVAWSRRAGRRAAIAAPLSPALPSGQSEVAQPPSRPAARPLHHASGGPPRFARATRGRRGVGAFPPLRVSAGDGGGGVGRRSDPLAGTIAHRLKMRFMSWRLGQAVDGDSQMVPHLLENTRNRLGNGRPHPELDPGIRMRFLSWQSGLAVSPRPHREPRRGVANQGNLGRPSFLWIATSPSGLLAMTDPYAFRSGVTKLQKMAPNPLISAARKHSLTGPRPRPEGGAGRVSAPSGPID